MRGVGGGRAVVWGVGGRRAVVGGVARGSVAVRTLTTLAAGS